MCLPGSTFTGINIVVVALTCAHAPNGQQSETFEIFQGQRALLKSKIIRVVCVVLLCNACSASLRYPITQFRKNLHKTIVNHYDKEIFGRCVHLKKIGGGNKLKKKVFS